MPSTSFSPPGFAFAFACEPRAFGFAFDAVGACAGFSRVIASGSLSLRSPWNVGWRMRPSSVHSVNVLIGISC